ncbi:hypothetical protein K438DRAFT_1816985 [Mycena galopus ATCC 62051]|nr:hypothetical protein K438DRAFT_1816985 [Mycena galopus ATCC 62051]
MLVGGSIFTRSACRRHRIAMLLTLLGQVVQLSVVVCCRDETRSAALLPCLSHKFYLIRPFGSNRIERLKLNSAIDALRRVAANQITQAIFPTFVILVKFSRLYVRTRRRLVF